MAHPGVRRAAAGFTLLEVLVAVALLGVFSLTAYRGLDTVLAAERQALGEMARWRGLARAFTRIGQDLRAMLPDALGGAHPGFAAETLENGDWHIVFDRQVSDDGGGRPRRVEYRYTRGELSRIEGQVTASLMTGLQSARVGFLDSSGVWLPAWTGVGPAPRALALDLAWETGSPWRGMKLRRVFLSS